MGMKGVSADTLTDAIANHRDMPSGALLKGVWDFLGGGDEWRYGLRNF